MIKEEQLYTKLVNQTSEFRDKQKQLEDELFAWLHASEELKMQPCQKVHVTMHLCTRMYYFGLLESLILCVVPHIVMHLH